MEQTTPSPAKSSNIPLGAADKATLFLRLFIGALLLTQAITKSQDYLWLEQEYPTILGIDGAAIVTLTGILELLAGVMLIVGLFTRLVAAIMVCTMLAAALIFFPSQGFSQVELKIAYAGIYLTLAISGSGRYALDSMLNWGKTTSAPRSK